MIQIPINPYDHFRCDDCGRDFSRSQLVRTDLDRCIACDEASAPVVPKPSGLEAALKERFNGKKG